MIGVASGLSAEGPTSRRVSTPCAQRSWPFGTCAPRCATRWRPRRRWMSREVRRGRTPRPPCRPPSAGEEDVPGGTQNPSPSNQARPTRPGSSTSACAFSSPPCWSSYVCALGLQIVGRAARRPVLPTAFGAIRPSRPLRHCPQWATRVDTPTCERAQTVEKGRRVGRVRARSAVSGAGIWRIAARHLDSRGCREQTSAVLHDLRWPCVPFGLEVVEDHARTDYSPARNFREALFWRAHE